VRDKVNSVLPQLPKTIQQPRVEKMDPDAAPVLSIALSAKNQPVKDITEYADKVLRRKIESVNGVGQVVILGGRQRQINVWLDADRLRGYNLTVTDVSRALQGQNIEIPGGRVDQGPQSVTLRTRGRVQTVAEFNDIVVRQQPVIPSGSRTSPASRTAKPIPTPSPTSTARAPSCSRSAGSREPTPSKS
jgi:HAE1 family hydrophobic/amphiphilic exporter-1